MVSSVLSVSCSCARSSFSPRGGGGVCASFWSAKTLLSPYRHRILSRETTYRPFLGMPGRWQPRAPHEVFEGGALVGAGPRSPGASVLGGQPPRFLLPDRSPRIEGSALGSHIRSG